MPRFQQKDYALFHITFNQRLTKAELYTKICLSFRFHVLHGTKLKKKNNETNNKFYIDDSSGGV
jgi:hypothetical protein